MLLLWHTRWNLLLLLLLLPWPIRLPLLLLMAPWPDNLLLVRHPQLRAPLRSLLRLNVRLPSRLLLLLHLLLLHLLLQHLLLLLLAPQVRSRLLHIRRALEIWPACLRADTDGAAVPMPQLQHLFPSQAVQALLLHKREQVPGGRGRRLLGACRAGSAAHPLPAAPRPRADLWVRLPTSMLVLLEGCRVLGAYQGARLEGREVWWVHCGLPCRWRTVAAFVHRCVACHHWHAKWVLQRSAA